MGKVLVMSKSFEIQYSNSLRLAGLGREKQGMAHYLDRLKNTAVSFGMDTAEITQLLKRFGHSSFRAGQLEVLMSLERDARALAVFPTGSGKSLCYQIPALTLEGLTLVVSPLIALMRDQVEELLAKGIPAARLDSSMARDQNLQIWNEIKNGKLKILYVSPERFNNERFRDLMSRTHIALFAIDEAHCISEWGHSFRPDYLKLAAFAKEIKAERILALTATATPKVVQDICKAFDIPASAAIITGSRRENLSLIAKPTKLDTRASALATEIKANPGTSIVYVSLQRDAENVAESLEKAGIEARAYHAGMEDEARTNVQNWWMTAPNAVVVATIAFGMGIDKRDVRAVYHYHLPKSLEGYSQEIGRAGRDGLPSNAVMLGSLEDLAALEQFAYGDTPSLSAVRALIQFLSQGEDSKLLNLYELGTQTNIRGTVLKTLLTCLELLGFLSQGTPQYATYQLKFSTNIDNILERFDAERQTFLRGVFKAGKMGRDWLTLEPDVIAAKIGQDRERIVKALNYLDEQNLAEVRVSDSRSQYTRLRAISDVDTLAAKLYSRLEQRESQDLARLHSVVALFENPECYAKQLARYFGDSSDHDCGQCSACLTTKIILPAAPVPPKPEELVTRDSVLEVTRTHPEIFTEARETTKFLCGLTSPKFTKAKLSKHALFGKLEKIPFMIVLEWCKSNLE
jgi:ATP-dependent DNA helicase RecQ